MKKDEGKIWHFRTKKLIKIFKRKLLDDVQSSIITDKKTHASDLKDNITKKQQISTSEEKVTSIRPQSPEKETKRGNTLSLNRSSNQIINKFETELSNLSTKFKSAFETDKLPTNFSKDTAHLDSLISQIQKTSLTEDQLLNSTLGSRLNSICAILSSNKEKLEQNVHYLIILNI